MKKLVLFCVIVFAAVGICVAEIRLKATVDGNSVEVEYPYKKDSVDEMVECEVKHYNESVERLIGKMKEPNAPFMSSEKIMCALGKLRAVEAVDVLIENINLESHVRHLATDVRVGKDYPARTALVQIGRPASLRIMDIVGNDDKFDEARLDGYANVLAEIEGPGYALMKLEERLKKVKNPEVRKQYSKVMDRIGEIWVSEVSRVE
jgi:hypothetical protein